MTGRRGAVAAAAVLLAAGACGGREEAVTRRIIDEAMERGRAWEKLAHLTDRIGPRLSGSENLEQAVRWCAEQLRRDGADRVWTEPVMVPHWVRGEESARLVAPVPHPIAVTALGGSVATPEAGVEGEVVAVTSFEELDRVGEKARGRIVFYNKPILAGGGESHGYGSASRLRTRGAIAAARLGAAAVIIRSLGTASYRLPHTGAMSYEEGVERIPGAAIAAEDADLIHRLLAAGETVRIHLRLGCRHLPDAPSANVLADLRGRERPEEVVLIGAHLDSWDLGTGAIDDGAGVAAVMEAVRVLRAVGERPRRTVRAVLFTNEENGLRGGRAYAETHRDELRLHAAAIESDSGGARPLGFGLTAGPGGLRALRPIAVSLAGLGAGRVEAGGGGADIGPLRSAGVPLLSLQQDTARYFDYHHTAADTLDKVVPRELDANAAALAVMAWRLAEAPDPLPRLETTPAGDAPAPAPPRGRDASGARAGS